MQVPGEEPGASGRGGGVAAKRAKGGERGEGKHTLGRGGEGGREAKQWREGQMMNGGHTRGGGGHRESKRVSETQRGREKEKKGRKRSINSLFFLMLGTASILNYS